MCGENVGMLRSDGGTSHPSEHARELAFKRQARRLTKLSGGQRGHTLQLCSVGGRLWGLLFLVFPALPVGNSGGSCPPGGQRPGFSEEPRESVLCHASGPWESGDVGIWLSLYWERLGSHFSDTPNAWH